MKTRSNFPPGAAYRIERLQEGIAAVLFFENIEGATGEENTYEYDEYRVEVPYRETLAEEIEKNFDIWLTFARDEEIKRLAGSVRDKRNLLLAEYDWTQNADSPLAPEKKAEWAAYRQALRDIPEQEGFPYSVVWPAKPE